MDPECVRVAGRNEDHVTAGRGDHKTSERQSAITSTQTASASLLPRLPVHRRPEEIGVAVVLRVLLDHVADDPSQAGSSTVLPKGRLWSG